MIRRHCQSVFRTTLAITVIASGLLGVTHFHFPASPIEESVEVVSTCGCPGHRHESPSDEQPAPSPDDCHFCKLRSQLSGESSPGCDFCSSSLVRFVQHATAGSRPVVETTVYWERGPPGV